MESNGQKNVIAEKGTYVKIRYCLKTAEGEYVKGDPREGLAVLEIFTGYNQLIPGLERRLVGKEAGEKMQARLPSGEAFGPYRPEQVKEKGYDEFPEGRKLEEGRWAMARDERTGTAYGYFVKKKGQDKIVLDYNHPLAGQDLIYDLEILEVRPATEEEQALLRPCEGPETDRDQGSGVRGQAPRPRPDGSERGKGS
jgi:FKBP-type peptidyl-prolyl cis-trans isomerase SlyD